jgi:ABC-type antimicrobial peptide transport system permease subunit
MTESLVLASLGAIVAVPVHLITTRGLLGLFPTLEFSSSVRPVAETRLLIFGILLILGSSLLCGLGPALQAAGRDIASVSA